MPVAMYCLLGAMLRDPDKAWRRGDIAVEAGYAVSSLFRYMKALELMGWVERPFVNRYMITERGKIAFAIEIGRMTKLRSQGLSYTPPTTLCETFLQYGLL